MQQGPAGHHPLFAQAVKSYQLGRLAEADQILTKICEQHPVSPEAVHLLGLCRADQGRIQEAEHLLNQAVGLNPKSASIRFNFGRMLQKLGRHADAEQQFQGAIGLNAQYAAAHRSRGISLAALQRYQDALKSLDRSVDLDAKNPEAWKARADVLADAGRVQDALQDYQTALTLRSAFPEVLNNRGRLRAEQGDYRGGYDDLTAAISLSPTYAEAFFNRGRVRYAEGHHVDAIADFSKALEVRPEYLNAWLARAEVLMVSGRAAEAVSDYDRALALEASSRIYVDRGSALLDMGEPEMALASYGRAIDLDAENPIAYYNRARLFNLADRHAAAVVDLEKAIALGADIPHALGTLAHWRMRICSWDKIDTLWSRIFAEIKAGRPACPPFTLLSIPGSEAIQSACARTYAKTMDVEADAFDRPSTEKRRLRIAYVSSDFHAHATAYLMEELFAAHSRDGFEWFGISLKASDGSPIRRRLQDAFDHFHDVSGMTDRDVALLMRAQGIDIAVDLKGYTENARPGIFARRAAPVQVSYLGYPATTGAAFMDYLIADHYVIPTGRESEYAEKVVRIPGCYQVNGRNRSRDASPPRHVLGLPEKAYVFCCFNQTYKITPQVFDVWMTLLRQVEGSVLWLYASHPDAIDNLRKEAAQRGIGPERLVFASSVSWDVHIARLAAADLFLDTYPYNAHTTASDALWVGLPVVTLSGETFASRVAGSLLISAGLSDLVTTSLDDYAALCLQLARNTDLLGDARRRLTQSGSAIFDPEGHGVKLEAAYRAIWARYREGREPAGFTIA